MKNSLSSLLLASLALTAGPSSAQDAAVSIPLANTGAELEASSLSVVEGESIEFTLAPSDAPEIALPGTYVVTPTLSGWDRGHVAWVSGNQYRWSNDDGASWSLTLDPSGEFFQTGPDNPYYYIDSDRQTMPILRGPRGEVVGIRFGNIHDRVSPQRVGIDGKGLIQSIQAANEGWRVVWSNSFQGTWSANLSTSPVSSSWQPRSYTGTLKPGRYYVVARYYHEKDGYATAHYADFYIDVKTRNIETRWTEFLGNENARGHLTVEASLTKQGKNATGRASANIGATLFGSSVDVFRVEVGGTMRKEETVGSKLHGLVSIGGYALLSYDSQYFPQTYKASVGRKDDHSELSVEASIASGTPRLTFRGAHNQSVFNAYRTAYVAGLVPVTFSVDLSLYAGVTLNAVADPFDRSLSIGGGWEAYASGTLDAGFGLNEARAGVYGTIELLKTEVSYPIKVDLDEDLSGRLEWKVTPVGFEFGIFAEVSAVGYKYRETVKLAAWSMSARELSIALRSIL